MNLSIKNPSDFSQTTPELKDVTARDINKLLDYSNVLSGAVANLETPIAMSRSKSAGQWMTENFVEQPTMGNNNV